MKNITERKSINVDSNNPIPLWTFKQEDDAVLSLKLNKTSIPFDVTGQTLKLGITRPNKSIVELIDGFTINKNEVDIVLKNNILAIPGICECDLEISDSTGKMTTASFLIKVSRKMTGENNLNASNDISAINKLVEDIKKKGKDIDTVINDVKPKSDKLMSDIKKDYDSLHKIIIDENQAANLQDQVNKTNAQLDNMENKENWVNVLDYGAKCDGVTDDSVALQNAINDIDSVTTPKGQWKRTLYVPAKLRITKEILIPFGQFKIKGSSLNNSQIFLDGVNACLNFTNTIYRHEIEFEDIRIKGNDNNNILIKMNKVMNIYFTRVDLCNQGVDKYAIEFTDCGIYSFDKCIIQGGSDLTNGGTRRGIKEIQNTIGLGSIISISGCNIWNLKEFMNTNGSVQKLNIYDNWCECVKTFLTVNSVDDMRYTNISIRDNFFNNHNEGGFVITEYCFIDVINTTNTDWFGGIISLDNNTFYLWDLISIKGNSLINMNTIKNGTELSINYNTNTFSGKRLDMLGAYVFNTKGVTNFLNSIYFRNVSTCLRVDTTRITDKKELIISGMNLPNKKYGSPNGIYFSDSATLNDGNIFYENGAFYVGVGGTIKAMPKKSNYNLSLVNTETVNTASLGATVNGIINALEQAQIITKS